MRRLLGSAAAALALALTLQPAWAQEPPPDHPTFGHTLMYGTGFINTPHAFAPGKTTIFGSVVAMFADDENQERSSLARGSVGMGLGGVLEVGATIYGTSEFGGFAKLQILRPQGPFPALAVGVQNVTQHEKGRYGVTDPFYTQVKDAASIYGTFTYVAGPGGTNFATWLVFTGGWGTGLFFEDNPAVEDDGSTGGVFGAVALDIQASEDAVFRIMMEHDGFDTNIAAMVSLAGLEVMVGVLSVDEGEAPTPLTAGEPLDPTRDGVGFVYNQAKPFISVAMDIRALGAFPWIWSSGDD